MDHLVLAKCFLVFVGTDILYFVVYTCRETKPKVQTIDAFLSAGRTCNVYRATKLNDKIAMIL